MSTPRSHRRDFLKGKAAARALEQLASQVAQGSEESLPQVGSDHYLVKFARRAMACQFEIWLNSRQDEQGSQAAIAALDLIDEIESQLTVYRDTSELTAINRSAATGPVEVEPRLFRLLSECVRLWHETERAFDITSAPLSELWGFHRRAGRLPQPEEIAATLPRVGSQHLQLDEAGQTIRFLREGIALNLGGIGKGYALDRCVDIFAAAEVRDYLMHGGNSSVLARGGNASRADGGWSVGVRNPIRPEQYLGELVLRNQALSTSGSGTQFFHHDGRRYGHILDPRTGWPAEGVLSVTIVAPTAAEAEACSTALYVLGPEKAPEVCERLPQIGCLMHCPGERAGQVATHLFNLAGESWLPAGG